MNSSIVEPVEVDPVDAVWRATDAAMAVTQASTQSALTDPGTMLPLA